MKRERERERRGRDRVEWNRARIEQSNSVKNGLEKKEERKTKVSGREEGRGKKEENDGNIRREIFSASSNTFPQRASNVVFT